MHYERVFTAIFAITIGLAMVFYAFALALMYGVF